MKTASSRQSTRVRAGFGLFSIAFIAFSAVAGGMLYQLVVEVPALMARHRISIRNRPRRSMLSQVRWLPA